MYFSRNIYNCTPFPPFKNEKPPFLTNLLKLCLSFPVIRVQEMPSIWVLLFLPLILGIPTASGSRIEVSGRILYQLYHEPPASKCDHSTGICVCGSLYRWSCGKMEPVEVVILPRDVQNFAVLKQPVPTVECNDIPPPPELQRLTDRHKYTSEDYNHWYDMVPYSVPAQGVMVDIFSAGWIEDVRLNRTFTAKDGTFSLEASDWKLIGSFTPYVWLTYTCDGALKPEDQGCIYHRRHAIANEGKLNVEYKYTIGKDDYETKECR